MEIFFWLRMVLKLFIDHIFFIFNNYYVVGGGAVQKCGKFHTFFLKPPLSQILDSLKIEFNVHGMLNEGQKG